jgi:hypothetical protein
MKGTTWGSRYWAVFAAVAMSAFSCAQSFNLDLDLPQAPPALGGGVPSSSFGAAANMPGHWNRMTTNALHTPLDINGNATSVQIVSPGGGGVGAFNNPTVTGDHALLLNDGLDVPSSYDWIFMGLQNGSYKLFTYAVHASGVVDAAKVTVATANVPIQFVTGPIQGNSFAIGKTHSVHDIVVTNNEFTVRVERSITYPAKVNGFQLVAVPEPASLLILGLGIPFLLKRKR